MTTIESCDHGRARTSHTRGVAAPDRIAGDERVEFLPEPPGVDRILAELLRYPAPTGKLINDAYLAAFAIASNRPLVTWDRGFPQFRGLRVRLLEA